jgi:drug/metabolite transporter (DMT)-like permease
MMGMFLTSLFFLNKDSKTYGYLSDGEDSFLFLVFSCSSLAIPAILIEDTTFWKKLTLIDWLMFISMSLLVNVGANMCNILSLSLVGASTTGSILAVRFISTIIFSWVVLGEGLKSFWQLLGFIMVVVSVSISSIFLNLIFK